MDKQQFEELMAMVSQIAANTRPFGRIRQILELLAVLVGIGGVIGIVRDIIQMAQK